MKSPIDAYQQKGSKEEENKIPKQVVMYISRPETEYTCDQCVFYKEKKCAIYGPTVQIAPYGGCNLWVHAEGINNMPWMGLATKLETGYTENKEGFSCKRCEEFVSTDNSCKKVNRHSPGDDPGWINPNGCCNRWEADPQRAKLKTEVLLKQL